MGLLTIVRKAAAKDREARVLLVGLDGAGTSTAAAALGGRDVAAVAPTLGFEIRTIERGG